MLLRPRGAAVRRQLTDTAARPRRTICAAPTRRSRSSRPPTSCTPAAWATSTRRWTFSGRSGHSARPWDGDNAIERAARAIAALADVAPPTPHVVDGLEFREVVSVTKIEGGIALNVVPDNVVARVNYRYPPGRTAQAAEARLHELCDGEQRTLTIDGNAPSGAVAIDHPLVQRLIAAGDLDDRPQAGVDAGRRARRWPGCRPSTSVPATRSSPTAATSRSRLARSSSGYDDAEPRPMELNPVLTGLPAYPFARLQEARAQLLARGERLIDFSVGEPREPTPAFIRQALVDAITPQSTYPLAAGLPELRAAIAAWLERRFGAPMAPESQIIPTLGSKEAIYHLAQIVGPGAIAVDHARLPGPRPRRALRRPRRRRPAGSTEDHGFRPDLDGRRPRRAGDPVGQLPQQPDRRHRDARRLRTLGRAGPRARLRPGQRRGLQRDLLRRQAARLGAPGPRPHERPRLQHALQALLDARLPRRVCGRRRHADRGA